MALRSRFEGAWIVAFGDCDGARASMEPLWQVAERQLYKQ